MNATTDKKPRKAYKWGAYDALRDMQPLSVAKLARGTREDAKDFSHAASRLGKEFGAKFSVRWYKGVIYATRFE